MKRLIFRKRLNKGPEGFVAFELEDGIVFAGVGEGFAFEGVGAAVGGLLEVGAAALLTVSRR